MKEGIYEQLINGNINSELKKLSSDTLGAFISRKLSEQALIETHTIYARVILRIFFMILIVMIGQKVRFSPPVKIRGCGYVARSMPRSSDP